MGVININGTELEIDMTDADVIDKYEQLVEKVVRDVSEPKQYEGLSTSDGIRLQCQHIDSFFDALFGSGTAKEVFKGSNSLSLHIDAFGKTTQFVKNTRVEIQSIMDKYGAGRLQDRQQTGGASPKNRAQRRAIKKNKGKYHR